MRVKMKTGLSGPKYSLSPNDEHDFSEYEAKRLIEAGFAESLETDEERAKRIEAERQAANEAAKKQAEELKRAEEEAAAKAAAKAEAEKKAEQDAKAAAEAAAADKPAATKKKG